MSKGNLIQELLHAAQEVDGTSGTPASIARLREALRQLSLAPFHPTVSAQTWLENEVCYPKTRRPRTAGLPSSFMETRVIRLLEAYAVDLETQIEFLRSQVLDLNQACEQQMQGVRTKDAQRIAELTQAFQDQVAHTDVVRSEYQGFLKKADERIAELEAQRKQWTGKIRPSEEMLDVFANEMHAQFVAFANDKGTYQHRMDVIKAAMLTYCKALVIEKAAAEAALTELRDSFPDDIRQQGWVVAVHNDYRLDGVPHTFWLFTKGERCVKGEGLTDADALNEIRLRVLGDDKEPTRERKEVQP